MTNFTIMVPSAAQIYEHVSVFLVVADSLDGARPGNVGAKEWRKIDLPSVFDINSLVLALLGKLLKFRCCFRHV